MNWRKNIKNTETNNYSLSFSRHPPVLEDNGKRPESPVSLVAHVESSISSGSEVLSWRDILCHNGYTQIPTVD